MNYNAPMVYAPYIPLMYGQEDLTLIAMITILDRYIEKREYFAKHDDIEDINFCGVTNEYVSDGLFTHYVEPCDGTVLETYRHVIQTTAKGMAYSATLKDFIKL